MDGLVEELDAVYYKQSVDAIVAEALTSDNLELRTRAAYVEKVNKSLIEEMEQDNG
jgi:hypothetical protein